MGAVAMIKKREQKKNNCTIISRGPGLNANYSITTTQVLLYCFRVLRFVRYSLATIWSKIKKKKKNRRSAAILI
jgi:hypothetical protein